MSSKKIWVLIVVNCYGGKLMENIYWESKDNERICHFKSKGLCYEYTTDMSDNERALCHRGRVRNP